MGKNLKGRELGAGISQRKDGTYTARFVDRNGKRQQKYFKKLAECRNWLEEAEYQDKHGGIFADSSMTVDAWFSYWIDNIKSKTIRHTTQCSYRMRYKQNIQPLIGHMVIADVKPLHCQHILNVMDQEDYSGGSMQLVKGTLNAMFEDATENGMIRENPVTKSVKCPKKREKRTRVMTLEEQKMFLSAAKKSTHYDHFLFVLNTGVRQSELRGLQWDDIDSQNRIIHIRKNVYYDNIQHKFVTGELKTSSGRRDIPMTDITSQILARMKNKHRKTISLEWKDHVFLNRQGKPTHSPDYNGSLKRICNHAGIEPITMHVLRHTFATRCIEAGMKPKTLQKILGHASLSLTMDLYVHVTDDEQKKEMRKLEELYKMA